MSRKIPVPCTPEKLDNLAKHIGETATHLQAVAESMRLDHFDEMGVANYDQMQRAMKFLDNFISAARGGLREKRAETGQFPKINGKAG